MEIHVNNIGMDKEHVGPLHCGTLEFFLHYNLSISILDTEIKVMSDQNAFSFPSPSRMTYETNN